MGEFVRERLMRSLGVETDHGSRGRGLACCPGELLSSSCQGVSALFLQKRTRILRCSIKTTKDNHLITDFPGPDYYG